MDISTALLHQQFQELIKKFPGLQIIQQKDGKWLVFGLLKFSAEYEGQQLNDEYKIDILIPKSYPGNHPTVREIGKRIPLAYHHAGDNLCLGEPGEVFLKFNEEPTLVGFTERCLVPYLFSFSFKERYGKLPFGELLHGTVGILEHYQEVFSIRDKKIVLALLKICVEPKINGHSKCPCGSNRRVRRCHGNILRQLSKGVPIWLIKKEYDLLVDNTPELVKSGFL